MDERLNELAFSVENECGCNERPIVLRALRDAARDFCIRSESWIGKFRYDNDSGNDFYDGAGALDAYVHRVLRVEFLHNKQCCRLHEREYELADANMVKLKKEHKAENVSQIRIVSVLIPNAGSDKLPKELITLYRDGLVYGACSRIVRQVGKEWFSPELEQMFQVQYLREVTKAICRTENEN
ncbi:MAG: hypothetical protein J5858_15220 [Lentisphaeria bacterium]|nr:hypothetical protein [Lentisphaeria bacterium]